MKKYSIKQIDEMRGLIQVLYLTSYGSINMDVVEDRLRTFMMAGKKPKELRKRIQEKLKFLKEAPEYNRQVIAYMETDLRYLDEDNAF